MPRKTDADLQHDKVLRGLEKIQTEQLRASIIANVNDKIARAAHTALIRASHANGRRTR